MKVYYITQVLKQWTNIQTLCPNYIHTLTNTNFIVGLSMRVG